MKKLHIAALVLALAFGLSACGGEKVEAPNSAAPVETAAPTATPTASPEATATPTPTPTPSPSAEPSPEPTPKPTAAPTPTPTAKATPAPVNTPAPTPKPQATQKPNVPQQNLSENAEKNVKIPQQENLAPDGTGSFTDNGTPILFPDTGEEPNFDGVTFRDSIPDEELWDPAYQVDTYLD